MLTLLFDIDGTLIDTMGAGGSALSVAFEEVFAVQELAEVPFSGRTDRGIVESLFEHHDIPGTTANHEEICATYLRHLPDHVRMKQGHILDGVVALLDQLAERTDARLGLLTGNLQSAAKIKLEHFGLFHLFEFGGFGDHHADRDDVARSALDAADATADSPVWVIGDTPLDIRCARAINARVLAVATGLHSTDELAGHAPDALCTDLSQQDDVLEILFSDPTVG